MEEGCPKEGVELHRAKLLRACHQRESKPRAMNVPNDGKFDPSDFSVEACQAALETVLLSRASNTAQPKECLAPSSHMDPGAPQSGRGYNKAMGQGHGDSDMLQYVERLNNQAPAGTYYEGSIHEMGATPGGMRTSWVVEAKFTRPDRPHERLCANCGSTRNLKPCGGCKSTFYCGRDCQTNAWKNKGHKRECKLLASERGTYKQEKKEKENEKEKAGGRKSGHTGASGIITPTRDDKVSRKR